MANNIRLESEKAAQFLPAGAVEALRPEVESAQKALEAGTCAGNDFLGWLHLPSSISAEHLADLKATAQTLRENCDTIVVAGIGGSYLGARAVIEALGNSFEWLTNNGSNPVILFAGNNIGEDYLSELCEYLKTRKFGVINISKSGTTTETALAFRLLKKQCEEQRGKEMARKVIVAITDAKKGAARLTANKEGYKSFIIPDNVGGRFSVLTPVGLLPIACAGFDIDQLVKGAADMEKATGTDVPFEENIAAQYAAVRNAIHRAGIVDVHSVAALGCPAGDVLGGGVLVQQSVDLGLDLGLGGLNVCLRKRQRGYIIRQGHIVQCADAGPVAVIVQPLRIIEAGIIEIRHLAVDGHACAGCGRGCRGAALLFEQHKAGRSYAQHSSHRAQHTQQDLGNAFQKRYLLKIADRFHGECKYHTILL